MDRVRRGREGNGGLSISDQDGDRHPSRVRGHNLQGLVLFLPFALVAPVLEPDLYLEKKRKRKFPKDGRLSLIESGMKISAVTSSIQRASFINCI